MFCVAVRQPANTPWSRSTGVRALAHADNGARRWLDDHWTVSVSIGIYTRLSHDATGEQTATARQERACRAFADLRGWTVAEVFEDVDVSAYKTGVVRPAYERLPCPGDQSGAIGGVLVWKLDRLVRRPAEFERFWSACEDRGAIVASATEPIDTSHELGLAIVRILVTFASLESATQSLRLKAKHRARSRPA